MNSHSISNITFHFLSLNEQGTQKDIRRHLQMENKNPGCSVAVCRVNSKYVSGDWTLPHQFLSVHSTDRSLATSWGTHTHLYILEWKLIHLKLSSTIFTWKPWNLYRNRGINCSGCIIYEIPQNTNFGSRIVCLCMKYWQVIWQLIEVHWFDFMMFPCNYQWGWHFELFHSNLPCG